MRFEHPVTGTKAEEPWHLLSLRYLPPALMPKKRDGRHFPDYFLTALNVRIIIAV